MTTNGSAGSRSTERRAEELMERVATEGSRLFASGSRWVGKAFGRAREELEDIVAEARSMNEHSRSSARK